MAKQDINFGTVINDRTGDTLRNGAQKINSNFTELYNLLGGSESISIVSKITAGPGLVASSSTGEIIVSTLPATTTQPGSVIIGNGVTVNADGVISVTPYVLPKAATNILGGIRVGDNLTINNDGVLSAVATAYTLPTASPTVKGGVKIGNGLEIIDSVLSVTTSEIAAALQSGAVAVQLEDDGDITGRLKASGPLIVLAGGQESNDNYVQLQWTQDRDNPDLVKSNYLWLDTNGISLSTTNPVATEFLPLYSNTLFYNTQGTLTFNDLGQVGPVQSPDGIDLYAPEGMDWTQLNYGNRNYVWVSANGAFIDLSPDTNPANSKQWEFNLDTSTVLPGSIEIKGNTTVALAQFTQLQTDYNLKLAEVNDLVSQLASKGAELGYWQGIIASGPLNPLYGQAVSNSNALILEIADLESASNIAQSELIAIANNLNALGSSLASPSVTLTYVVEDGVLDINNGAVRFPDGTIQTTAYLGTALPDIVVDRLTNGEFEVILGVDGTLTVDGIIYSTSNMSVESITDTSITAGTDLKLYSSGLFALRNYSTTDSISIVTNYNTVTQKAWSFNNNGSTTLPTATVPATAKGAAGDQQGMFIVDDNYIYYCKQTYTDGVANIWNRTAQTVW